MSTELISVRPTTSVEEAVKLMVNSRITGLPVVDEKGKMVGVLSEYDVIVQIAKKGHLDQRTFSQPISFSSKVESISEMTPLSEIIDSFVESRFRRLPVVDKKGKLIGIITRRDLMKVFYYRAQLT